MTTENYLLDFDYTVTKEPNFSIDESNISDYLIATVSTYRSAVYSAAKTLLEKAATSTVLIKVTGAMGDLPFSMINIALSSKEEGILQATVTGIAADGSSIIGGMIVSGLIGGIPGAIGGAIVSGILSLWFNPLADDAYDAIFDKKNNVTYDEKTGTLTIGTYLNDLDDIKTIVQPTAEYLKFEDELLINDIIINQTTVDGTNSYTIQYGDSVWDICNRFKLSYEDLINSNPWLADRFDDDLQFCLIKPGEKLLIPFNQDNPQTFLPDSELPEFAQQFNNAAQTDPIYRDPLLIDLNGDGITTTDVNNGIYFDHDVNGFAEKSAWVSNDDGILAFDVNNNGVIDNGSEIFGDAFLKPDGSSAQSGFDALSSLDSNNDNIIDANDSQFNNIKILKADGSLISLAEAGIVSISLNAQASNTVDENGNTQLNVSSFTKADGSTGSIADYTFVRDTLHTQATDIVEVPDDILALPDAQGYGNVSSLHQAMAKDSSGALKTLVQDFVNASSETDKLNLVKQIILKWTGVENIAADSRGEFYNAQQLAA